MTATGIDAADERRAAAVAKGLRIRELRKLAQVAGPSRPPAKKFLPYDADQFQKDASLFIARGDLRTRAMAGLRNVLKGGKDPKDVAAAMFVNNEVLRYAKDEELKELGQSLGIAEEVATPKITEREIARIGFGPMRSAGLVAKRSLGNGARVLVVEPSCAAEVLAFGEESLERLQVTVQTSCPWKAEIIKHLIPSISVVSGAYDDALPQDGYYDAVVCGGVMRRRWGDNESQELLRALVPGVGLLMTEALQNANTPTAMSQEAAVEILQNAAWIGSTTVGMSEKGGQNAMGHGPLMVFRRREKTLSPSDTLKEIQRKHGISSELEVKLLIEALAEKVVSTDIAGLIVRCPDRPLARGVESSMYGRSATNIPAGCLGLVETESGPIPVMNQGAYQYQLTGTTAFESKRLLGLAEIATGLRELRWRNRDVDVEAYEDLQRVMQEKHAAFVGAYGPMSSGKNAEILGSTGDWINIVASEVPDSGKPAGWMTAEHRGHQQEAGEMTIDRALMQSLRSTGHVDLDFMGGLMEQSPEKVRDLLGDRVLLDPMTMRLHIRANVLSGDVIAAAEEAEVALSELEREIEAGKSRIASLEEEEGERDGETVVPAELLAKREELKNVLAALREVRPSVVPLTDIAIKLSDKAIPCEAIEAFFQAKLKSSGVTVRDLIDGTRELVLPSALGDENAQIKDWSTDAYDGRRLAYSAVSKGMIVSTRKLTQGEEAQRSAGEEEEGSVVDDREMDRIAANEIIDRMNTEFRDWLLEPQQNEIGQMVEREWNRERNRFVETQAPAELADLEGLNPMFVPREYQIRAASKGIMSNRGIFFHFPGAGKTLTTAIVANTHFRSGAKTRLLYLAPAGTLPGAYAEMSSYFPDLSDKIRILSAADFRGEEGAQTLRRSIEMPFTLDMMSYDTFKVVGESRIRLEEAKARVEAEILYQEKDLDDQKLTGISKEDESKQEERLKKLRVELGTLQEQIGGLPQVTLGEMGYEGVFADEADLLRNLRGSGSARGTGMSGNKLTDCFKAWVDQEQARDPRFMTILETGTLMGRSITEYYTFQRYVQEEALRRQGIDDLSDWTNAFCKVTTSLSISLEGKIKSKDVVSVANHRELRNMLAHIVDVVTEADIMDPSLLPNYRGGGQKIVTASKTKVQAEFYRDAMKRIALVKSKAVDPKKDNALKIYGECVAASLGGRMVGLEDEPDPENKIGMAAVGILHEFIRSGGVGTQLVFLDRFARYMGTEGSKKRVREYDAMEALADVLVAQGIPRDKIIRLHDVPKGRWAKELNKINDGDYAVVLTSRGLVGRGVNIQRNLIGDWHLDMPWNPNEFLQSLRRARRPGNQNKEIFSNILVTEGSAERLLVESNRNKMGVENEFWRNSEAREFTSLSNDFEPSLMEMEAEILGGDNRLKELARVEGGLKRAEAAVKRENYLKLTLPLQIERARRDLAEDTKLVDAYLGVVAALQEHREEREKTAEAALVAEETAKEPAAAPQAGTHDPNASDKGVEPAMPTLHKKNGEVEMVPLGVEVMGVKVEGGYEDLGRSLYKGMMKATMGLKRSDADQRVLLGSLCGGRVKMVGIKAGVRHHFVEDKIVLTMDEKDSSKDFLYLLPWSNPEHNGSKIIGAMRGVHLRLSAIEKRCNQVRAELEKMEEVLAKCGDSSKTAEETRAHRNKLMDDLRDNPPNLEGTMANAIQRTPAESKAEMEKVMAPLRRQVLGIVGFQQREKQEAARARMKAIIGAGGSVALDAGAQKPAPDAEVRSERTHPFAS